MLNKVDVLIIGGGMSYTFMNALGYSVGNSLCEEDKLILFDKFCEIVYDISQNCLNKNKIRGNTDESDRHCEKSG